MTSKVDPSSQSQDAKAPASANNQALCLFPPMTDGYLPDVSSISTVEPRICAVDLDTLNNDLGKAGILGGPSNGPWAAAIAAAWSLVLAQYVGTDDAVSFLVTSNATAEFTKLLAVSVEPNQTVSQMVKAVDSLLSEPPVRQDSAGSASNATVNTAVMFDDAPHATRCELSDESGRRRKAFNDMRTQLRGPGLLLMVSARPHRIGASLAFHPALLSDGQAENVSSLLTQMITEISRASESAIKDLNYVSDEHLNRIWNFCRAVPDPWFERYDTVIDRHVARQPSASAIDGWDAKLSYEELGDLSTQLAKFLQAHGVRPGVIVPLCFERSAWAIVAMISVAKAGGAFVSIPPYLPQGRKDAILEMIQAPILLTTSAHSELWEGRIPWTAIEDGLIRQLSHSDQPLLQEAEPNDPLYIIFTSGSTGAPKGVMVSHTSYLSGGLLNAPKWNYGPHSRVLQMLNHTFDMSLLEILTGLGSGSCVCVPHNEEIDDSLAGAINKYNVNHAVMTPSLARGLQPDTVPGLKTLCLGGEAWPQEIVERWSERITLNQFYGPSECSINSTTRAMRRRNADPLNIGPANAAANWVVKHNDYNSLVPIGVQGELLVSGPIVGLGYLKNPEKTAMAFVEDVQFVQNDERFAAFRFYRTGDLVRQNSDGTFTFCGRVDSQVKLNGQRIELGEVDYHLALDPQVHLAIATLPKDGRCRNNLVAVITLNDLPSVGDSASPNAITLVNGREGAEPQIRQALKNIRTRLHNALPRYMVPTLWIFLERMPMSPSGKIDRVSLDRWIRDVDESTFFEITGRALADRLELRSKLEADIQEVWADVLQLSKQEIGRHRPFVSFGGDSIQAQAIVARCRKQGIVLELIDILVCQGVAEASTQASYAESKRNVTNGDTQNAEPTKPQLYQLPSEWLADGYDFQRLGITSLGDIEDVYPSTSVQEDMLIGQWRRPGAYHMRFFIQIIPQQGQAPDLQGLHAAWESVIARHAALRTTFVHDLNDQSGFHSVVLRHPQVKYNVRKISSSTSQADILQELTRSLDPFNQDAPFLRLTYCVDGGKVHHFMFEISHALIDRAALELIIRDLIDIYNGKAPRGVSPPYKDFVAYSLNQDQEKNLKHWTTYMKNAPPCIFPVRHDVSHQQTPIQPMRRDFEYAGGQALEAACKQAGVTIASAVQAAWSLVLRSYTSSRDVSFGYLATGRNAPVESVQGMVGLCLSILPCRVKLGRTTLIELARSIQLNYTKTLRYQHFSFSKLKQELSGAAAGGSPFNTVISVEIDRKVEPYAGSSIALNEFRGQDGPTDFDLATTVKIAQGKFSIGFLYWPSIDESQIRNVGEAFMKALDFFVEHRDTSVDDLSLGHRMNEATMKSMPAPGVAPVNSVLEHVEQQAVWNPERPALASSDGELTHAQLSHISSRMAQYLIIDDNVNKGDHILVCLGKSSWAIITLLAIAKAGAVFVPTSPKQDTQRLSALASITNATMIITDTSTKSRFEQATIPVMNVDEFTDSNVSPSSTPNLLPALVEEDRLAVLFGDSKPVQGSEGVIVDHGPLAANVLPTQWKRLSLSPATRTLQFASFSSYLSLVEIFTTLAYGGCVCVPAESSRIDDLASFLIDMHVNWAIIPPSVSRVLDPSVLPELEDLVLCGEPVLRHDLNRWERAARVYHAFGVAETAGLVSLQGPLKSGSDIKNVGHPMSDDIRFWITETANDNRLAPPGSVGRLVVESPRVTSGYLDHGPSSCSSILMIPAWRNGRSGGSIRMYKTDQLARYNEDGSISLVGSRTESTVLAGRRIDLDEISQHVWDCWPQAQAVSVKLIRGQHGSSNPDSLVAFIGGLSCFDPQVLANDQASGPVYFLPVPVEVTRKMVQRLPAWMIPAAFFGMPSLPVVPNTDIIDHERLRQIGTFLLEYNHVDEARQAMARQEWAEATQTERRLQDLFSLTLRHSTDQVRLDNDFFDLGGDIHAAKLLVQTANDEGLNIRLSDVFCWPSIRKLAWMLSRSPTTPEAMALQQIWAQTLNIPQQLIGLDDSFLETSAKVLVERIRREGYEISVEDVYNLSQLSLMASKVMASNPPHPQRGQ